MGIVLPRLINCACMINGKYEAREWKIPAILLQNKMNNGEFKTHNCNVLLIQREWFYTTLI